MENKIVEIIKKHSDVDLIYIFGSFITARFNNNSDIDIAILTREKLDIETTFLIKKDLFNCIERDIDLIDLKKVNISLIKEIIYKGKIIFKKSEKIKTTFEYKQCSLYGQFIDDISVIKEKIKERGTVYGRDNSF